LHCLFVDEREEYAQNMHTAWQSRRVRGVKNGAQSFTCVMYRFAHACHEGMVLLRHPSAGTAYDAAAAHGARRGAVSGVEQA